MQRPDIPTMDVEHYETAIGALVDAQNALTTAHNELLEVGEIVEELSEMKDELASMQSELRTVCDNHGVYFEEHGIGGYYAKTPDHDAYMCDYLVRVRHTRLGVGFEIQAVATSPDSVTLWIKDAWDTETMETTDPALPEVPTAEVSRVVQNNLPVDVHSVTTENPWE